MDGLVTFCRFERLSVHAVYVVTALLSFIFLEMLAKQDTVYHYHITVMHPRVESKAEETRRLVRFSTVLQFLCLPNATYGSCKSHLLNLAWRIFKSLLLIDNCL